MTPISVLLADDSELMRKAIRRLLGRESEIEVIGEAENFAQMIKMITDLRPNIVIMDLHMPDGGSTTHVQIKATMALNPSRLIAISIWDDKDAKSLATNYGASMVLDKAALGIDLIPAIKAQPASD